MNFKNSQKTLLTLVALSTGLTLLSPVVLAADTKKAFVDFRLRYETVDQDNSLKNADALTLRTLLHYQTSSYNNWSAVVEFEDSREVLGVENYNDTLGNNTEYSVVADPNTTELDQGFIQYKAQGITAKVGRQVLTFDGHRFIGHVGWRQDKQTFDGASVNYNGDKFSASYAYLSKRNRIFADDKDIDSKDHLLNAHYIFPAGKLTAYGYLLEIDQSVNNSLDTYGVSFDGKSNLFSSDVSYRVEYARQSNEVQSIDYDADYFNVEAGTVIDSVTVKLGFESLTSDDGEYGFSTPLATLHKFNGWSDQFLATPKVGLDDLYISASMKLLAGKVVLAWHDFDANDDDYGIDDLGSELNLQYTTKFAKNLNAGVKFAAYSAGDKSAGKVDTDKVWVWVGARF